MDLKTLRNKYKHARQRIVREFANEKNAKLHDDARCRKPTPNKEHFTEPLDVVTYLNQIRPKQESLRRFSYVSYEEPMPSSVKCSYNGCTFEATAIDQMTDHQASAQHPGWGNLPTQPNERPWVCGKCGNTFHRWGTLYVHLATHSLPFSCDLCPYKAGRQNRLKTHMETKHGKKLDTSNRWSLQNK